MFVRIHRIRPFSIHHCHRVGQLLVGHVVVAYHKINSLRLRIRHLFNGLDTTIQGYNQLDTSFFRIIYPLHRNAVTFVVTIWNIIVQICSETAEKFINQSNGRGSIHIVIAINQDAFLIPQSFLNAIHRLVHIR